MKLNEFIRNFYKDVSIILINYQLRHSYINEVEMLKDYELKKPSIDIIKLYTIYNYYWYINIIIFILSFLMLLLIEITFNSLIAILGIGIFKFNYLYYHHKKESIIDKIMRRVVT